MHKYKNLSKAQHEHLKYFFTEVNIEDRKA